MNLYLWTVCALSLGRNVLNILTGRALSVTESTQVSDFHVFRNFLKNCLLFLLTHFLFFSLIKSSDSDLFVGIFDFIEDS